MYRNIKFGFFLGLILSSIFFLRYLWNPISLLYFENIFITLLISLSFIYWAIRKFKKGNNENATYKEVLKVTLVVLIVSQVVTNTYDILFHNIIAPNYYQSHKTEVLAILTKHASLPLKLIGADERTINEMKIKFDSEADMHLNKLQNQTNTIKGILFKFADNLFSCLVFSIIISAFLKKKD